MFLGIITIMVVLVMFDFVAKNSLDYDENKVKMADALAAFAHRNQKRKFTGEPYIVHPRQVHDLMMDALYSTRSYMKNNVLFEPRLLDIKKITPEQLCTMRCAAKTHDIKEDCPDITDEDIVDATDINVLKLVYELTNPSKGIAANRAIRKKMDRDHLATVSWAAKFIKLCDRICNLRDLAKTCPDKDFLLLYAKESKLLLDVLRGTDIVLEDELANCIQTCGYGPFAQDLWIVK